MINRRKMFGFAAVLPLAAVGVSANNAPAMASTKNEADKPSNPVPILTLQGTKPKVHIRHKYTSPYAVQSSYTINSYEPAGNMLGISVGDDGHMWLKIGEDWKRVVVE